LQADISTPPAKPVRPAGRTDPDGTFRMSSDYSWIVVGFYLFLVVILIVVGGNSAIVGYPPAIFFLSGVLLLFLGRYLSTRYAVDSDYLRAWRLFGTRKVRLDSIRAIEYGNLRDLGPVGFFGSWGWRGRMWSPSIGPFDSIQTGTHGLLVTGESVPLFISPKNSLELARELSRRVRSYTGALERDVGAE